MSKIKQMASLLMPVAITAIAVFWFVVYPILDSKAIGNCQAINEGRRASTNNWNTVKEFVEEAAKRVDKQAIAEAKDGQWTQAAIDFQAAAKYRTLKSQINTLPQRDC